MLKVEFHGEMTPNRVHRLKTNTVFAGLPIGLWDACHSPVESEESFNNRDYSGYQQRTNSIDHLRDVKHLSAHARPGYTFRTGSGHRVRQEQHPDRMTQLA